MALLGNWVSHMLRTLTTRHQLVYPLSYSYGIASLGHHRSDQPGGLARGHAEHEGFVQWRWSSSERRRSDPKRCCRTHHLLTCPVREERATLGYRTLFGMVWPDGLPRQLGTARHETCLRVYDSFAESLIHVSILVVTAWLCLEGVDTVIQYSSLQYSATPTLRQLLLLALLVPKSTMLGSLISSISTIDEAARASPT
jgi:hypothetical protein